MSTVSDPRDVSDPRNEPQTAGWENLAAAALARAEDLVGRAETAGVTDGDDIDAAVEQLLAARSAFARFDRFRAAQCLIDIAGLRAAEGDFDDAFAAFHRAGAEFADLGDDALAADCLVDAGAMALEIGEFDDAEPVLQTAIRSYHRRDDHLGAAHARLNLANVYRLSGRPLLAQQEFGSLLAVFDDDTVPHALCQASLAELYVEDGDLARARPLYELAAEKLAALGDVEESLDAQLGLAWVLIATDQTQRGRAVVESVRAQFQRMGRADKVAVCDYTAAAHFLRIGDFAGADAAFIAATAGLAAADLHHQLPKLQWNRVTRLLHEAAVNTDRERELTREAVDTALAALIAADYERFQFTDVRRRRAWTRMLERRITTTFFLVEQFGSPELLADLIDVRLSAGVYGTDAGDETAGPLVPAASPGLDTGDDGLSLTLGAATLLVTNALPLAPPPTLVDDSGRILLERQRRLAAALDPELAAVLATAPRVPAW